MKELLLVRPQFEDQEQQRIGGYELHIYDLEKNILVKVLKKFDKISKEK